MVRTVCCCQIESAASAGGILQLSIIAITVANYGALYQQWSSWALDLDTGTSAEVIGFERPVTPATTGKGYLGVEMANSIAFKTIWICCLLLYVAAFHQKRAVLVLPDIFVQLIGLLWSLHSLGTVGQAVNEVNCASAGMFNRLSAVSVYQGSQQRCAFLIAVLILSSLLWLLQLFLLFISITFFRYLRQIQSTVHPESAYYASVNAQPTTSGATA